MWQVVTKVTMLLATIQTFRRSIRASETKFVSECLDTVRAHVLTSSFTIGPPIHPLTVALACNGVTLHCYQNTSVLASARDGTSTASVKK